MAGVRMGEMAITTDPRQELVALGLGSCVGLAMLDRAAGIAGLAHVVLPEAGENLSLTPAPPAAKFADRAVPELLARMRSAGAHLEHLEVAIAGGAKMFATAQLDIGARNVVAVERELAQLRLHCHAAETGGDRGRTLRVSLDGGATSASAGQPPRELLSPVRARRARRTTDRTVFPWS